jgi:ComF family protein
LNLWFYIRDFFDLLLPQYCLGCNTLLVKGERFICTKCKIDLPRTNFHLNDQNPVAQMFWGRVLIENATSFFYFQKGNRLQQIIHKIKYKGEKEAGYELGAAFGYELINTPFDKVDFILPGPLTNAKQKQRGYNQSEWIAMGISNSLKIPVRTDIISRVTAANSQTRKNRFERWLSVEENFAVLKTSLVKNKHVLLVDDVVTTGATLEACATVLTEVPDCKVSIATLAYAL